MALIGESEFAKGDSMDRKKLEGLLNKLAEIKLDMEEGREELAYDKICNLMSEIQDSVATL